MGLSFTDIYFMVGEQWPDLVGFDLTYSVGQYENCRLGNQADLNVLYSLVNAYAFKVVDTLVATSSVCLSNNVAESSSRSVSDVCNSEIPECNSGPAHMGSHWNGLLKGVGQKFDNVDEFRKVLNKFWVESGFQYRCYRNTKQRVKAICVRQSSITCLWTLTATVDTKTGTFIIRNYNPIHDCDLEVVNHRGDNLSKKVLSELIENEVKNNPSYTTSEVVKHFSSHYGYAISYKKAWRALTQAIDNVYGDHTKSYQELMWWTEVAKYTNPRSHIVLQVNPESNRFDRLFVSFGACIQGFKYMRPMIFIDATFLSGLYQGTLLCATGKNGQGGLYLLAYAVVDAETSDNWFWFLNKLSDILDPDRRLCFFSDRNLGILDVVPKVFPKDDHYFCIYHLKQNIKLKYGGGKFPSYKKDRMVDLFNLCAYAATIHLFDHYMAIMRQEGGKVMEEFLEGLPVKHWAKAYSVGCRYGEMASSVVESFNSWVLDCRGLPILQLVDGIRIKLMKWHLDRKEESAKWTSTLCKGVGVNLRDRTEKSRSWLFYRSSKYIFEVRSEMSYAINVFTRYYSCGRWQVDNFPCDHALASINKCNDLQIHDYVEKWFFTSEYRKAYEHPIYPIPTSMKAQFELLGLPLILAPTTRRGPGRPRKKRYRSRSEKMTRKTFTCGRCKKQCHSRRSCKGPLNAA